MKILVINAGSSSVKYQLINIEDEHVMAKGLFERIGEDNSLLKHQAKGQKFEILRKAANHSDAMKIILGLLTDKEIGVLDSMNEISAVGHRIVHGGEYFCQAQMLDDKVIKAIKENIPLAPLHNPANIMGIEAFAKHMPDVCMVGVFDTAYHQTMPAKAFLYAIPSEAYKKYKIRRYGFHGISHHYVAERAAYILKKDMAALHIITCHLGNGSSVAAINRGKVIDTSMGFTPLEGVAMGTRSGDIDPTIVQYMTEHMDLTLKETMDYLNKNSGVLGISGISSDFRDLITAADEGNENAALAIDVFCYRIKKYIGAYIAAMGNVDAIVFTAGIGENAPRIRKKIIDGMMFLDSEICDKKNNVFGKEAVISSDISKVTILTIPTNEELMIARETRRIYETEYLVSKAGSI